MEVEEIGAVKAVQKYRDRNVFMAWPPYETSMAARVANAMESGRILIYVGEPQGGCTGNNYFFSLLANNFTEIDVNAPIRQWEGIHDYVYMFVKK